jgi:flavin-dependent dehydrogenase
MSNLPARSGILPPRAWHRTVQATWSLPELSDAEIFLGRSVAPGSFGYGVSMGNGMAKVGIINRGAARSGYRRVIEHLLRGPAAPVGREVYRRIPMGASRRSVAGRVIAVGDAAGQTKTTTGGGIYYAMLCARLLAETVLAARRGADFRLPSLGGYERAWRRRLGMEIQAGLWMRGLFEHVGDDEVSRLVAVADSPAVRELLHEWSFDYHRRLLLGLARVPELRVLGAAAARDRARRLFESIVSAVDRRRFSEAPQR